MSSALPVSKDSASRKMLTKQYRSDLIPAKPAMVDRAAACAGGKQTVSRYAQAALHHAQIAKYWTL